MLVGRPADMPNVTDTVDETSPLFRVAIRASEESWGLATTHNDFRTSAGEVVGYWDDKLVVEDVGRWVLGFVTGQGDVVSLKYGIVS